MALLLPRLSKSSGSSVRINVWRQRRASLAPVGRVFPKSPDLAKSPDEKLDLTTIGLSNKYNFLFPVVGNDRIPSSPMDYKKIGDDENGTEVNCTAPNLPELPGLPGERRGLKTPTEPPDFCLKGEGQRHPPYVIGTSKIENSPGGMVLKSICTQLHSWFETLSGQNVDESSIQEELKRLLYIKKMRIYLEVRKKLYSPEVHCVPIFHCPCCLEHWTVSGWAPENCLNPIQPSRGPEVVMYGTKMRFVSMHPKGKPNILNKKQEYTKRKIGLHFGASRPQYSSNRTKERQDSSNEPLPSSTSQSRASNHSSRDEKETKTPDLTTLCSSTPREKISAKNTFPDLGLKEKRNEETAEGAVRTGAREPEGIPPSKASMSLIQSISQNDDHYNEYARSSSRNGRLGEWRRRNIYCAPLFSDDPKSVWKTHMLASPVLNLIGDGDKAKKQNAALTPASSHESLIWVEKEDFEMAGKVESTEQSEDNAASAKTRDVQQENLDTELSQSKDQVHDCEEKQTEKTQIEKVSESMEKQEGMSSLERPSTGEKKEGPEVPPLRHCALKKIDKVTTRHTKTTLTWSDKKVLPNVSSDSAHKGFHQPTSMEVSSPSASNAVPDQEVKTKRSLTPPMDHLMKESKAQDKALRNIEEQIVNPENKVIKHDLEKLKLQDLQLADLHSQRMVESSSAGPLRSKADGDGVMSSRGRSDSKTTRHPVSSGKESFTIERVHEGLIQPHRRRTLTYHKKERKSIIKRPKHAFHSKEIESGKAETLIVMPQAFIKPQQVPESKARYEKESSTHIHERALHTQDALHENVPGAEDLPPEHAQGWVKQDIDDEFRTVVADIRKDVDIADLDVPSRSTPTVERGNKMDASLDEDDDVDDDFFEEVDSKTELFARTSSEIQRLPVSNAFTFSFYELPSQYKNRNKKLAMASLRMGRGRRKYTI